MSRRCQLTSSFGALTLSLCAAVVPAAAHAAVHEPARGDTTWVQLSSGTGLGIIDEPDVTRFGKQLQVVWTQQTSSSAQAVRTRLIGTTGAADTPVTNVVSGWSSLAEFPAVIPNGNQRVVVFSGIDSTDTSDPYSAGYNYYATSPDGVAWTLANGTLGSSTSDYASYGSDAADAAGTPISVSTPGTTNDVAFHKGFDSLPPVNGDGTTKHNPDCCAYFAGAATDATSGETWATWYSNSGKPATDGIDAERIDPASGTMLHAPKSTVASNGSASSLSPIQRIEAAPRTLGGVYTAYVVGYPSATKMALWRLGSTTPLVLSTGHNVAQVGVASGSGGRMWLFWKDEGAARMHAVRTNAAVTRFGRPCTVTPPHATTDVWSSTGDGVTGPLTLVVNAGPDGSNQLFATEVKPCLSAAVRPSSVKSSAGGSVTVHVTDAGAAVRGVTVRYAGASKKTDRHGNATFKVARGTSKGKHAITFAASGYTGGKATFRVT